MLTAALQLKAGVAAQSTPGSVVVVAVEVGNEVGDLVAPVGAVGLVGAVGDALVGDELVGAAVKS